MCGVYTLCIYLLLYSEIRMLVDNSLYMLYTTAFCEISSYYMHHWTLACTVDKSCKIMSRSATYIYLQAWTHAHRHMTTGCTGKSWVRGQWSHTQFLWEMWASLLLRNGSLPMIWILLLDSVECVNHHLLRNMVPHFFAGYGDHRDYVLRVIWIHDCNYLVLYM